MFTIVKNLDNVILLAGRFDASQVEEANNTLKLVTESCTIDFKDLDYISSAGLGALLGVQKRLDHSKHHLTLINMNDHIRDIFKWAGFDMIFEIK
jgi:anti-anti-sigma factor